MKENLQAQKDRQDYPEQHAHPMRWDPANGSYYWYLGWQTQGHTVRRWNGRTWDDPMGVTAAVIRRTKPCAMPDGAEVPAQ